MHDAPIDGLETSADLTTLDNALRHEAALPTSTRRSLLGRAAVGVAALAGTTALGSAVGTSVARAATPKQLASALATNEAFGVTFLTNLVQRIPGHAAAKFLPVLKAANQSEYDHLTALERHFGAAPLTLKFWIPDAFFGNLADDPFVAIGKLEVIELSAYLGGVTGAAKASDATGTRILASALGTEAEHRVLARSAAAALGGPKAVPNDRSFEAFEQKTIPQVTAALHRLGIGIGVQGSKPGGFFDFPGNPLTTGTGHANAYRTPM